MVAVEEDNGGHLIGTVYPGEPVDLDGFEVPDSHVKLPPAAEAGLARLRADRAEDFETVICGDQDEGLDIIERRGDLAGARR